MNARPGFEKYPFDVEFLPAGEATGCVITFPDLPGCMAEGATEEEAIAHARGAFHDWMTLLLKDGQPIPLPYSAAGHTPESSDALTFEQRERIRANIRARGMTIEVFLPESLADWLREKLATGVYADAREVGYLAFQDLRELDRHPEVRRNLLEAMIKSSMKEPGRIYSPEEIRAELRALHQQYANAEPPTADSTTLPVPRKFSRETIQGWIVDDEDEMRRFQSNQTGEGAKTKPTE